MKTLNVPVANRPALLVSVRNPEEAREALEGGAEIIDIKEPSRGSLGKADDIVIAEIVQAVRESHPKILISAALGELRDWENSAIFPRLPSDIGIVKVGLSGLGNDGSWKEKWQAFRDRVQSVHSHAPSWVMVAYADWIKANAPAPKELIVAAQSLDCGVVLLDTFLKDGRSLFEILSPNDLAEIQRAVHARNLDLAIAGSLRKVDLARLDGLLPDIVAIRSAACRDGRRDGPVCPLAVREFRNGLNGHAPSEAFPG